MQAIEPEIIDACVWAGREQAFALVSSGCHAARAHSLKQLRETRAYERLGLTWEEFCKQYANISRVHADRLIAQLDEFGETFFKLSEIVRISPEVYREIAPHLNGMIIDMEGERLPITVENAPRIRMAIQNLRTQLRQSRADNQRPRADVTELVFRLDHLIADCERTCGRVLGDGDAPALRGLFNKAIRGFTRLSRNLPAQPI